MKITEISHFTLFISVIHFTISSYFDSFIFIDPQYFFIKKYIVLKIINFLILIFVYNFLFKTYKKIKHKDENYIKKIKIFGTYFSIMLLLLIVTWPGVWKGDEYYIYQASQNLQLSYWHHYITSLYYILCLMFLPFGAGIVIVQLLIISLIVSRIIFDLSFQSKNYYWLYLVFLLPPIMFHNLYPMRATMVSFP